LKEGSDRGEGEHPLFFYLKKKKENADREGEEEKKKKPPGRPSNPSQGKDRIDRKGRIPCKGGEESEIRCLTRRRGGEKKRTRGPAPKKGRARFANAT